MYTSVEHGVRGWAGVSIRVFRVGCTINSIVTNLFHFIHEKGDGISTPVLIHKLCAVNFKNGGIGVLSTLAIRPLPMRGNHITS
ncbi:hypothetical protein AG1IA_07568 [Rhizoctonia solani AG-1 IA]|uniref:Uncharacterized protein n=1 Tax=Thanatephorus cucumeris (strain AG1-IA) TaxID=983506 RepID=L8WPY6_THACA|nr:hypothetical protein AG1IA_07568 [Rhizoctonia solani AG-1 IA]